MREVEKAQVRAAGPLDTADSPTLVLDTIPAPCIRLDAELRLTFLNRAAETLFESPREQWIGKTFPELQPTAFGTTLQEALQRVKTDGIAVSLESYFEPRNRWYALDARPDTAGGFVVHFSDISERKQLEERYRHVFEDGPVGLYRTSPEGRFLTANPALARMLRYDSSAELMAAVTDSTRQIWSTPEDRTHCVHLLEQHGAVRDLEYRLRCKDGAEILVSIRGRRVAGSDGETRCYEGFVEEITDQARQQTALQDAHQRIRERERQLSALFDSVPDALFLLAVEPGPNWRFVTVNSAFLRLTGLSADQVVGQTVDHVIPGPSLPLVLEKYRQAMHDARSVRWEETSTYPTGTRCGEVAITPIFAGEGHCTHLAGLVHDVTETRRTANETEHLQEQLRRSQKLESLGRLAGGVAHDFNNLLTVINGYASMLAEMGEDQSLCSYAREIQKAGEKAADLTHQLLAFGRKQMICPKPLDLAAVVKEAERMLHRLMGEDVEFVTSCPPDPVLVMADPAQLHQVIVNIAANARESMPQGGRFEISVSSVRIDGAGSDVPRNAPPGRYARITLRDNGPGMTEEVRRNIFEPFFTTKQAGRGSGLGLASVYGIVRQSGGWIDVQSLIGRGTAFHIYLPRVDSYEVTREAEGAAGRDLAGSETVLIVEDNEGVRELTAKMLRGYGYRVIEAPSGPGAIEAAKSHNSGIDLLLTDVVMPGMRGNELAHRIQELYPQVKVLLMSGYAENMIAHRGPGEPNLAYIQKPFNSGQLALKIRQVLG